MTTVLITGIGLVGKSLGNFLLKKRYNVNFLTRNPNRHQSLNTFKWDLKSNYIDLDAFKNVTILIHLAGTNISDKRWTKKRKKDILNSRILSTELLISTIQKQKFKLNSIISISAIGYYGAISSDKIYTESDPSATDFLGRTCMEWEKALLKFETLNCRTVILRSGVVLSKNGGALSSIVKPIKMNVGAYLGKGEQYIPWIHLNDLIKMLHFSIINNQIEGIFNAVSPSHITNIILTNKISKKLDKMIVLPKIPAFLLFLIFGEMASLILYGSRVSSQKIVSSGYEFEFENLDKAIEDLIN